MKKILMVCGIAAVALGSMASCQGSGSSKAPESFEDSLSQSVGTMSGSQLNMQYASLPDDVKKNFDKQEMLNGIKQVLMTDTTKQSYVTGMQIALQLWGQIYAWERAGVKVDRSAIYDAYAKAFLADSVSDMTKIASENQVLLNRVNQIMIEKQQAEAEAARQAKENSPEAKKGIADGKAFLDAKMKEDPAIKKTDSGLAYKVISEGQGESPKNTSKVVVAYKGTLINGKEFDANDNATFPVAGVIPGFAEGLTLMKPGAHYILYIPGNLGYGVDGTPDGSIGPNDMLVFDVTLKSVE